MQFCPQLHLRLLVGVVCKCGSTWIFPVYVGNPFLWKGYSSVVSFLLTIILFSSIPMWSFVFFLSSWYCLMPSLKQLINYQELSNSAVISPRRRLPFCLKCQSWWKSETPHVFWHSQLCGPSAWGWFSGKRVDFNKQDAASPPAGLLLLLFVILQRQVPPYAPYPPLPQHSIKCMNKSREGTGTSGTEEQGWH